MKTNLRIFALIFFIGCTVPTLEAVRPAPNPPMEQPKKKGVFKKIKNFILAKNTDPEKKLEKMALLTLLTSILGIIFFPLNLLSLLFGLMALRNIKKSGDTLKGKTLAYIGIGLGGLVYLGLLIGVGFALFGISNL